MGTKQRSVDTSFKLIVDRGAFHYDKFVVTMDKITYIPDASSKQGQSKYNNPSKTPLDSTLTVEFLREIQQKGFWELKNRYKTESSCASELIITLEADGKSKTVICDDFDRDCPDLIKYIDKKVVELEGNDLKRIYLPG